ncbi:MAG TPA: nucleoside-diphosphate sugar epimerase [Rhodoferax sp.]
MLTPPRTETEANMAMDHGRVVMVAGATGLVGREIVTALLVDSTVDVVHCVGRRPLAHKHPKLLNHVVDFAALPALPNVDECYIALGTTIKVAGSQAAFRAIDLDAVVAVAKAAQSAGATKFGVVSAMGANTQSRVFYNRIKGEVELALVRLGLKSLIIARPLLLMRGLRPLLPVNYRTILAKDVAHALIHTVKAAKPGVVTLLSSEMQGG